MRNWYQNKSKSKFEKEWRWFTGTQSMLKLTGSSKIRSAQSSNKSILILLRCQGPKKDQLWSCFSKEWIIWEEDSILMFKKV